MRDWQAYVRQHLPALACAPECEAEIVEEIALQLEGIYRTARAAGSSEDEAFARVVDEVPDWHDLAAAVMASKYPRTAPLRRAAQAQVRRIEEVEGRPPLGDLTLTIVRELKHAVRALAASPLFTATSLLTLALGIGVTTAVFSLVNSVLLAPLPYREPSRLALVQQTEPEIADRYPVLGANPRSFRAWERACRATCQELAAIKGTAGTLTGGGEPEGVTGARISPGFFDVLGIRLVAGRGFTPAEDRPGADDVVVLSHRLWARRFGSDAGIVGRSIELNGRATQVVGVAAPAPVLPRLEHLSTVTAMTGVPEFFRPSAWSDDLLGSPGDYDTIAIVRLARDATVAQAEAELAAITATEFRDGPIHPTTRVRLLEDHILAPARRPMSLLLASVVATLVIACVNVANLLGARWVSRRREVAIRAAMGATTGSLLRLIAVESGLLAAAGGAAGLLLAFSGLQALVRLAPVAIPRLDSARLDQAAFGVAVLATVACGIVCSLLPAWHGLRRGAGETLKAGAHTTTDTRRSATIRTWFAGAEVALTAALLVIGGLLVASLRNVLHVNPGFQISRILAVDLKLPDARYPTAEDRERFFTSLLASVHAAPGVESAGIVRVLPFEGEATVDVVATAGDTRPVTAHPVANHLQVSPGYFRRAGTAARGRPPADRSGQRPRGGARQRTHRPRDLAEPESHRPAVPAKRPETPLGSRGCRRRCASPRARQAAGAASPTCRTGVRRPMSSRWR